MELTNKFTVNALMGSLGAALKSSLFFIIRNLSSKKLPSGIVRPKANS